ncbi:Metallo-dependent phosphatase [Gonapodya prolifera JEL478]|uniref:Metallo-dependent phosphatase n=1 Tax=Gonapodya prolifera (strain JEL478) TaxID=1344416 RepID=A0A139A3C8_GONPJ|nr:Metallo-dependent phosphatase [Gonapodya prolifera JEL478]|eukprot:KXS11326.1 Metallo-dependent phosphatase [Gonapodya prolifera JEL478]
MIGHEDTSPILLFQFGDPQIGLGTDHADRNGDTNRLLFAVNYINKTFSTHNKVMLMMGDQVLWHSHGKTPCPPSELDGIKRGQDAWEGTVLCIPGNHDVWDPPTRSLFLSTYTLSRSYTSHDLGPSTTLICLDTTSIDQKYKPADFPREDWDAEERHGEEQVEWLERELVRCEREGREVVVAGHYPLFLFDETEAASSYSLHPSKRAKLVNLLQTRSVHHYLAGHVHRTMHGVSTSGDLHCWIVAGTALAADEDTMGYGVRAFEIHPCSAAPSPPLLASLPHPLETFTSQHSTVYTSWIKLDLPHEMVPPSCRELVEKHFSKLPERPGKE